MSHVIYSESVDIWVSWQKVSQFYWSLPVTFISKKISKKYNLYLPDLAESARLRIVENRLNRFNFEVLMSKGLFTPSENRSKKEWKRTSKNIKEQMTNIKDLFRCRSMWMGLKW